MTASPRSRPRRRRRGRRGRVRRRVDLDRTSGPTSPSRSPAITIGLDESRPGRGRAAPQGRPAHRTRERRRPRRRGLVRRVRRRSSSPRSAVAGRVEDLIERTPADGMIGGIGTRQRRPVRRSRRAGDRGVVRLHRARRHAGHAEPPQEGPAVRGRRAAAAAGRVLHRGRRRPAGRHRQARRQRSRLPRVHVLRPSSAGSSRSSASTPATASPATRRSSAAATS